jgi:adenylosuccinate synthase
MPSHLFVGGQWGDEGKGKIVDLLGHEYHAIARYQGGHNAGHTVVAEGKKYVFHLVPSGVLHPNVVNVLGNGVVIDIPYLKREIQDLQASGIKINRSNFRISDRAHVILPYHIEEEKSPLSRSIGTTNRGIGPAYTDKAERTGLRIAEFDHINETRDRVEQQLRNHFYDLGCRNRLSYKDMIAEIEAEFEFLKPFVDNTSDLLNSFLKQGEYILCEGAQGHFLDVDHGTYPFVTSSSPTAGGAATGLGIPANFEKVLGIVKAYTTRVGNGPFPTELNNEIGERMRERGHEYGASTGRSRRCGWEDLVAIRTAAEINGFTDLALMKADVLDTEPEIRAAVEYEID